MNKERGESERLSSVGPQWVKVRAEWIEQELTRRSCLDLLMSRFGLDAALVSVPQAARVLGMSKTTIYASIKAGKFFIPHRLVGASPVLTIDDVVTWYLTGHAGQQPKFETTLSNLVTTAAMDEENYCLDSSNQIFQVAKEKSRRDRAVDELVRKAALSVGRSSDRRVST